jgi:hypothetical protein
VVQQEAELLVEAASAAEVKGFRPLSKMPLTAFDVRLCRRQEARPNVQGMAELAVRDLGGASRLDAARLLAEELATRVRELAGEARPTTALGRLLAGTAAPDDVLRLGLPVCGCRLLVMEVGVREPVVELVRTVRLPFAWHDDDLVVVVRRRRELVDLASRVVRLAPGTRAGASSTLREASDLRAGYDEARLVRRLTGAALSFADEEWTTLAMARLTRDLSAVLTVDSPLRRLADVRPEFLASLVDWLRFDGDAVAAANAGAIHPNTLRYRLKRVEQQVGLDLSDPESRLLARLFLDNARA